MGRHSVPRGEKSSYGAANAGERADGRERPYDGKHRAEEAGHDDHNHGADPNRVNK